MSDLPTATYYNDYAAELFERYESIDSRIADYFAVSFPTGSSIMDVGAGSGRDLNALLSMGYDAYGIEPSESLRNLAIAKTPELEHRLFAGALPGIQHAVAYDGVLCSAVFMHIPQTDQVEALISLRNLLKPGGRLLMSIPSSRPDIGDDQRDLEGRLFELVKPEHLQLLAARLGLELISRFDNADSLGRVEVSWTTLLFERRQSNARPLDRIESVLRNDHKVATYKLALLRAFCDLAERDERAVDWMHPSRVSVPVAAIAELWLRYYWPLVAASSLIPQNNAEARGGKPITFRNDLVALQSLCNQHYGDPHSAFSLFLIDWKKQALPPALRNQLNKALLAIKRALVQGPVKYSERGQMFSYHPKTRSVLVDSELWIEFCLTGYWVKDSLLLRWAELTRQFAGKHQARVSTGVVMELLLSREEVEREQRFARALYVKEKELNCVWSGKKITARSLDVDHALPYSLFHNNDLWNLLPADKQVNNAKRDKVPAPGFLSARRDALVAQWRFLHQAEAELFTNEVTSALGRFRPNAWEIDLFTHLKTRAEHVIYARGAKSWQI